MKLILTSGAVSLCALLASGAAAYTLTETPSDNLSEHSTAAAALNLSVQNENETTSDGITSSGRFSYSGTEEKDFHKKFGIGKKPYMTQDLEKFAQYGLTADEESGCLLYGEKLVKLFVDKQDYRNIVIINENGEINVKSVYDDDGNLTGLEEMSDEEYAEYETQYNTKITFGTDRKFPFNAKNHFDIPSFNFDFKSRFDAFDFNIDSELFDDYEKYGINLENGSFYYDGKKIGLILFNSHAFVLSSSGEINIKAVYNENGELTGFEKMSEEEYNEYTAKNEKERTMLKERLNEIFKDFENSMKDFINPDLTDIQTSVESESI